MSSERKVHTGGCHCGRVRWQIEAPSSVVSWKCNCSYCSMRGVVFFSVPSERFVLLSDAEQCLTLYSFGTHTAEHRFCKFCGITSFYTPRSNPDRVAVAFRCIDSGTLTDIQIKNYDGKNWERSYHQTGIGSTSRN